MLFTGTKVRDLCHSKLMIDGLVTESNREWFIRMKDYLLFRYEKVKTTMDGIGIYFSFLIVKSYE